jgi:hypothetical protein
MKALIILSALFISLSQAALADTRQCTEVLNVLTQNIENYTQVFSGCLKLEKEGETNSRSYEGYRRIARKTEENYAKAQSLCYEVCADTFFCEGEVSGACAK